MITAALFVAALIKTQDFAVPPGASSEFRKLALEIESAIAAKDFPAGSKLVALLPNTSATYRIDLTKVAESQRASYKAAIVKAANSWQASLANGVILTPAQVGMTDIRFQFEPSIVSSGKSVSAMWQWIPKTSPPQLSATFAMKRATGQASATDVTNNARITFGRYFGLATATKTAASTDQDVKTVQKIQELSRVLRESIAGMAPDFRVPVGASSEFHHLVISIENALSAKDFVAAEKLGQMLPGTNVTWSIDVSKLDENQKSEFFEIVDATQKNWTKLLGGDVAFKQVKSGKADIAISFEPVLAKIAGTNEVAGATWFLGVDSTQPRIEAVIGLKRGKNLGKVVGREVFNECQFTFGRYLGLAPSPLLGSGMGRIEGQMVNINVVSVQEVTSAKRILSMSHQLREAIQKKQIIESTQPSVTLERTNLVFGDQIQGDEGRAQMLLTNTGNAPLDLELRGDCGCISGIVPETLAPGKSTLLTGVFNTTELAGDVHHNLILKTNDPDRPIIVIPVSISVVPRAEIVFSDSNTIYLDSNAKDFIFYLNSADKQIFKVIDTSVIGMPFTVKLESFQGEVSNFVRSGAMQKIRGYKVIVDTSKLSAKDVFGRSSATVYFRTDNPKINFVKAPIFVQNGIVSLPDSIYFGSPQGVSDSTFILMRPGRPFKVLKVSSDSKYLTFETKPNMPTNPSTYTVRAIYDGKAPGHRLKGTITVETDDPKQATIKLPFQSNQT